jgi:hypothetical protein
MPDAQSILLALYQQILSVSGVGQVAREQTQLEAAAAQRLMLSGFAIDSGGVISVTVPPNLPMGASDWFPTAGTGTVHGVMTVQPLPANTATALQVTGTSNGPGRIVASFYAYGGGLGSFLHFSDNSSYNLGIGSDLGGSFVVATGRTPGAGGSAGTTILTVSPAGVGSVTGSWLIGGLLTVNGFGAHTIATNGTGANSLTIQNGAAGTGNTANLNLGNDASATLVSLVCYSSAFTTAAPAYANGLLVTCSGAGGIAISALSGSGKIELWTAGAKHWTVDNSGLFQSGTFGVGNVFAQVLAGAIALGNAGTANTVVEYFYNANGSVGTINTSGSNTAYNTVSDARLKTDRGLARETSVLERTEIHDYDWIVDGVAGRGVFSQDAHRIKPEANTPGSDDRDAEGRLVRPWSTDYSKYVPDLIVGWQQHQAALAALRAEVAALKERA